MRRTFGLMFIPLLGACALAGCGQKGPLYLPVVKPAKAPTAQAAGPVRPAEPATPASTARPASSASSMRPATAVTSPPSLAPAGWRGTHHA